MIGEGIMTRKIVPLAEIETLLSERKKENELTYEQDKTLKYTKIFSKISEQKTKDLIIDLKKIEGMNEELAVKIADILPTEMETMKLMPKKSDKVTDEGLEQALKLVGKYYKKKE